MMWARVAAAFAIALLAYAPAHAQTGFPSRSLSLLVPYSAGSVADVGSRLVADKLHDVLNQQVVVENRPGAGGIPSAKAVLGAAPDGYTMLLAGNNNPIAAGLFKSLPYNILTDFKPVSMIASFDLVIITRAASPLRTVGDVIKTAKANPGKLNVATTPVGSTQNLAAELLKSKAGIDIKIVPFRTTSDQATAVLRGDVDFAFEFYAASEGLISDKQVHVIATTGPVRTSYLPNVPTVMESGLDGYDVVSWIGLSVPAATPPEVIAILNKAANEAVPLADANGTARKLGLEMRASTPEALSQRIAGDIKKWTAVIEGAGIPKQ